MAWASAVDCGPSASSSASAQWRLTIFAGRRARMKSRSARDSGSDHGAGPGGSSLAALQLKAQLRFRSTPRAL